MGIYDDTLIVLVSDHGEEFFEHAGYWHGLTLYEEQLHVPLILKLPQNRLAGSRLSCVCSTWRRRSLLSPASHLRQWKGVPLIRDGALIDPHIRYVLSETDLEARIQRALRGTAFKLIRRGGPLARTLPPSSLFDLQEDALEQTNLADASSDDVHVLESELMRERGGDLWR